MLAILSLDCFNESRGQQHMKPILSVLKSPYFTETGTSKLEGFSSDDCANFLFQLRMENESGSLKLKRNSH